MAFARLRHRRDLLLGAVALVVIGAFGAVRATASSSSAADEHATHLHDDAGAVHYAVEFRDPPDRVAVGQTIPLRFAVAEQHEHEHEGETDDGHVHTTIHIDVVVIDPQGTETYVEPSSDLNDHRVEVVTAAGVRGAYRVVVRTTDGRDIGDLVLDAD